MLFHMFNTLEYALNKKVIELLSEIVSFNWMGDELSKDCKNIDASNKVGNETRL